MVIALTGVLLSINHKSYNLREKKKIQIIKKRRVVLRQKTDNLSRASVKN